MQHRLFDEGDVPECSTPTWYEGRDRAAHLEQDLHRPRLEAAAGLVIKSVDEGYGRRVVDLGAGDGGLLSLLKDDSRITAWGYDLQPTNLAGAAERGVDVRYGDILGEDIEFAKVAVATECCEHLVDPHGFVKRIYEHADVLICSSPWTETAESHYEFHLYAWDHDGYRALLEQAGFKVVDHETVGMFQVIRGVRPDSLAWPSAL